jgi:hypothetical protein
MNAELVAAKLNEIMRVDPNLATALLGVRFIIPEDVELDVITNDKGELTMLSLLNTMLRPTGTLVGSQHPHADAPATGFVTIPIDQVEFKD